MRKEDFEREFEKIPFSMKNMYTMRVTSDEFSLHSPSYVSIPISYIREIKENKNVYTIDSDIISVSIWKNLLNLHITVFHWKGEKYP